MLKDILDAERTARQTVANEKAAIDAEHAAIVAGIHAEFAKHRPELLKLQLVGDYGRTVELAHRLDSGRRRAETPDGITIYLGKTISPEELVLSVSRREGDTAPIASLQLVRHYPYKSDPPSIAPGHSPAETLVRGLLSRLAPHIYMEV